MLSQEYFHPNCWLGVSVEDQQRADERIPLLLQTPAAVRFVSYEPALGPVDFANLAVDMAEVTHDLITARTNRGEVVTSESFANYPKALPLNSLSGYSPAHRFPGLDWIIVGGESGPGARPFDIGWARDTVAQCKAAGVACFVKQGGSSNACEHDRKGGHFDCFPDDLKVREFPDAI